MAIRAAAFALEDGLTSCRISRRSSAACSVADGVQVGHDGPRLELRYVARGHRGSRYTIANDRDHLIVIGRTLELHVRQINTRHIVAIRTVAAHAGAAVQQRA